MMEFTFLTFSWFDFVSTFFFLARQRVQPITQWFKMCQKWDLILYFQGFAKPNRCGRPSLVWPEGRSRNGRLQGILTSCSMTIYSVYCILLLQINPEINKCWIPVHQWRRIVMNVIFVRRLLWILWPVIALLYSIQLYLDSFIHGRMARGGHGLSRVSSGPAMPYPFTLCGRATPQGRAACGCLLFLWTPHSVRVWFYSFSYYTMGMWIFLRYLYSGCIPHNC